MSIGTAATIALGVGAASAASSLATAKIQSNAAKNAAAIQTASQDKAQGFNQQVYNDQRQLMSPYVQAGNDSLAKLMQQHWGSGGLSPGMRGTTMQPGQQETPGSRYTPPVGGGFSPGFSGRALDPGANQAATAGIIKQMGGDPSLATGPTGSQNPFALGPMASPPVNGQPMAGGPSPYALGSQAPPPPPTPQSTSNAPQGQLVKMRAPDGTVQMVDPAHVAVYRAKGAQVVA